MSGEYVLRTVTSDADWDTFHSIRERVLWTARGQSGYDRNHPHDRADGNHPLILYLNDEPVGVLRIDVDGTTAWLRRVAVREHMQRQGHGRRMLELAADFAINEGCAMLRSFVDAAAIDFYRKVGFEVIRPAGSEGGMLMERVVKKIR